MSQRFDVSVKLLFRKSNGVIARELFGDEITEWLNIELPQVENPRVDLLAPNRQGALRHVELQAHGDAAMAKRQLDYYSGFWRLLDEHVEQVVLYVGKQPMRMPAALDTPSVRYRYRLIDVRDFDGERLLESGDLGDNMLALLTHSDQERVLRRVEERLRGPRGAEQASAAQMFMIISGLRDAEEIVTRRLGMIDIMENKVLGPAILRGERQGLRRAVERLLIQRFGPIPARYQERLEAAGDDQLTVWLDRVLPATRIGDVFAD